MMKTTSGAPSTHMLTINLLNVSSLLPTIVCVCVYWSVLGMCLACVVCVHVTFPSHVHVHGDM